MTGLKVIDGTPTEISKYLRQRDCEHKKRFGREVADNKIERVCCDCGKIIDYVKNESSGWIV